MSICLKLLEYVLSAGHITKKTAFTIVSQVLKNMGIDLMHPATIRPYHTSTDQQILHTLNNLECSI